MGKLTTKEVSILITFIFSIVLMALAVADYIKGGANVLEFVELSLITAVLARVI